MTRATSFAAVLLLVQFCSSGESADRVPDAKSDSPGGWKRSFKAGSADASGRGVGGTEIVHLISHKGRLYAGNGYWMDTAPKVQIPWAQVLVLDSPEGRWKVDLALGPRHLRVTILKSVTFRTDGSGAALNAPVSLLLVGSDHHDAGKPPVYRETNIWTRNDDANTWVKTTLQPGKRYRRSVRALLVHRDRKTGVDRIFVAAGALGIYSGVYDPDEPGRIRWDKKAELGPLAIRPMSFAVANGSIYASAGTSVYRRLDGLSPKWVKVYSDDTPEHWELGGIRGLTAVPSPRGAGESLLFSHTNRIIRVDPANSHKATIELKIGQLLARNWGRRVTGAIIAAYTDMLPISDPATGRTVHIMGVQGRVSGKPTFSGWYPGGSYLIRYPDRSYRLKEVNGRWKPGKPMLVAPRTFALSPFSEDAGHVYFGGFDANFRDAHNTAWIFRAPVETVLALAVARAAVAQDQTKEGKHTTPAQAAKVGPVPGEIRERFKLKGDFYAKHVDAEGIPILSSAKVNDAALIEARHVALNMLRGREDILETMLKRRIRLSVMAWNEFNTDMPESKNLSGWWDRRSRGISGVKATTCGEENLLNYRGDPFVGESILVHEFAHAFQHSGMSILDRTFNARVRAAYNKAKASGQFRGYAMTKAGEFFAEGAQSWFNANRGKDFMRVKDGKKTSLSTRERIIEHVPDLAKLLRETFRDNPWRYTPTHKRSDQEHLKDFDRTKAPRFFWPKDVLEAWNKELARRRAQSKRAAPKPD